MPLVAENSWQDWANSDSKLNHYTSSWDLDFPPADVFVKLYLNSYFEWWANSEAGFGISNVGFKLPDGSDDLVWFGWPGSDRATHFQPNCTHVSFAFDIRACYAMWVWTTQVWA